MIKTLQITIILFLVMISTQVKSNQEHSHESQEQESVKTERLQTLLLEDQALNESLSELNRSVRERRYSQYYYRSIGSDYVPIGFYVGVELISPMDNVLHIMITPDYNTLERSFENEDVLSVFSPVFRNPDSSDFQIQRSNFFSQGGVQIGYGWEDIRLEAEYFRQNYDITDQSSLDLLNYEIAFEGLVTKINARIKEITGQVYEDHFVGNIYYTPFHFGRVTPYIGAGFGTSNKKIEYSGDLNASVRYEFLGQQFNEEIASGITLSDRVSGTTFTGQLLAGADFKLFEHLSAGVKFRYMLPVNQAYIEDQSEFEAEGVDIPYVFRADYNDSWSVGFNIKVHWNRGR